LLFKKTGRPVYKIVRLAVPLKVFNWNPEYPKTKGIAYMANNLRFKMNDNYP